MSLFVTSVLLAANFTSYDPAAAASLPNPIVSATALALTPSFDTGASQCLSEYGLGSSSGNDEEVTATFQNYSAGTQIRFRIFGQSGQVTHVIDFVTSTHPNQCNNLVTNSGNYFPVMLAGGTTSLRILGIPNSVTSGYFQSVYVSGSSTSANVTSTALTFVGRPTTTIAPTTTLPPVPIVTLSAPSLPSQARSTASSCVTKYGLVTDKGYTRVEFGNDNGYHVNLRLSDANGFLTRFIDYIPSTGFCYNFALPSSADGWFTLTVPHGLNHIYLIGLPNPFPGASTASAQIHANYYFGSSVGSQMRPVEITSNDIGSLSSSRTTVTTSTTIPATTGRAGSLALPVVTVFGSHLNDSPAHRCLSETPLVDNPGQIDLTFSNYAQETTIRFRLTNPLPSAVRWLKYLIDYVPARHSQGTGGQCNYISSDTAGYFRVKIPSTNVAGEVNTIFLLGLPKPMNFSTSLYSVAEFNYLSGNAISRKSAISIPNSDVTYTVPQQPGLVCSPFVMIAAPGSGQVWGAESRWDLHPLQLDAEIAPLYLKMEDMGPTSGRLTAFSLTDESYPDITNGPSIYNAEGVPVSFKDSSKFVMSPLAWSQYVENFAGAMSHNVVGNTTGFKSIENIFSYCSKSKILLVGYSQGAAVIHEFLGQLTRARGMQQDVSQIAGVLLIADPFALPQDTYIVGGVNRQIWLRHGDGGIMQIAYAVPNWKSLFFKPFNLRNESSTVVKWTSAAWLGLSSLWTTVSYDMSHLTTSLHGSPLLDDIGHLYQNNAFQPTKEIMNELGSPAPIFEVAHSGDIVADPSLVSSLTSRQAPWTIHTSDYVNDSLLTGNEAVALDSGLSS